MLEKLKCLLFRDCSEDKKLKKQNRHPHKKSSKKVTKKILFANVFDDLLYVGQKENSEINLYATADKQNFSLVKHNLKLPVRKNYLSYDHWQIGKLDKKLFYILYTHKKDRKRNSIVFSNNLKTWQDGGALKFLRGGSASVLDACRYKNKFLMFFGDKNIKVAKSKDFLKWRVSKSFVLKPRRGYFDYPSIKVVRAVCTRKGILLFYFVKKNQSLGAVLLDKENLNNVLWRSANPIWQAKSKVDVLNISYFEKEDNFVLHYRNKKGELYELIFAFNFVFSRKEYSDGYRTIAPKLNKLSINPILKPRPNLKWDSKSSFNAAAIYLDGKVHILYRAVGDNDSSVLGYAGSKDGIHIDERLDEPVYVPKEDFETNGKPINFASPNISGGGGYGGCEDPRITKLGDRIYLFYVAYNGVSYPRLAMTSISVKDFLAKNWNWERARLVSRPGIIDKSGALLPEKIDNKFVVFHRVFPDLLIDFVDDLDFDGETKYLKGEFKISPREDAWDSRKLGVGATPLKTKDGWLVIYNGMDDKRDDRYQIGAMLLDLKDPRKVLYRSPFSVLEPTEDYENNGYKFGVVYPCGAVIIKDKLFVYYGGSDKYLAVAEANLDEFLNKLKASEPIKINPVEGVRAEIK